MTKSYFRFSIIDSNFNIYVNGDKVSDSLLHDLAQNTQFLWKIENFNDTFLSAMDQLEECVYLRSSIGIKGYIATVKKPSHLKIRGTDEKATIDLFVNGRLREKDILRHFPTSRIVESYAYGQIHFDSLDSGNSKDVFTSSREGIISDDPSFSKMLEELKSIFNRIIDDWDKMRRKHGNDGDPDNKSMPKKARKAQELFNASIEDMKPQNETQFVKKGGIVEKWVSELAEEAQFNIPSYTECFISENLLRHYIKHTRMLLTPEAIKEAEMWKKREKESKGKANISYDVRQSQDDLYYLDMAHLANLIDKVDPCKDAGLSRSADIYKPVRDAVGHTSILTDTAKNHLSVEYENIKARLIELLKEIDTSKGEK